MKIILNFKLIAFDINAARQKELPTVESLWARVDRGEKLTARDLLLGGVPIAKPWLDRQLGEQNINAQQILESFFPRPLGIPEMVTVPKGRFKMGSDKYSDEQPFRKITITKDFAIGKHPVTNGEWRVYLEATGKKVTRLIADPAKARHPVISVSRSEAVEYCQWLREVTGKKYRLPTEAEWEYAARGPQGLEYPYGNTFDASKCNFNNTDGTTPVDQYPEGASWCGALDMSGNVWEWVGDWYAGKYDPNDSTDPKGPMQGTTKVLRGGSWDGNSQAYLRGAFRLSNAPQVRSRNVGFRVGQDL